MLGTEWERERRDTLLLLFACALTVIPHVDSLPLWCTGGFMLLLLWRFILVITGHRLPGPGVRTIATITCLTAIASQYETMIGREVGITLLVLFLGLKLMELRARRDSMVVICLCFFLLLTSFTNSQSALQALLTLVGTLALITTLLTMHDGHGAVGLSRRIKLSALLILQALPVAATLFILFPRANGPLWGQAEPATKGRTGLSDTMTPGSITDLVNHDEVAMRVEFFDPPPAVDALYWRGPTLGHFNGKTWHPLTDTSVQRPNPEVQIRSKGRDIRYRATIEPHPRSWLFALDRPVAIPHHPDLRPQVALDFELLANQSIQRRVRYEGTARPEAEIGLNETPASLEPWRQLPVGRNPRALNLAQQWRRAGLDDLAIIHAAINLFRQGGFQYTMQAPALGEHPVDDFLFQTRAGFCEHYASAMVILMRAAGIPARVVTGYHGAEHNSQHDYWVVRQSDAHAWTEIWIAHQGWLRIDPTHTVAASHAARQAIIREGRDRWSDPLVHLDHASWVHRVQASIDGLTHHWNQWVLNYDRSRQESLLTQIGLDPSETRSLAAILAVLMLVGLGTVVVLTRAPTGPSDPVERAYQNFCTQLAASGAPRHLDETPSRYLRRIERLLDEDQVARAHRIIELYERLRYDPSSTSAQRIGELRQQVRAFRL